MHGILKVRLVEKCDYLLRWLRQTFVGKSACVHVAKLGTPDVADGKNTFNC